jgi:hypothetical protein
VTSTAAENVSVLVVVSGSRRSGHPGPDATALVLVGVPTGGVGGAPRGRERAIGIRYIEPDEAE